MWLNPPGALLRFWKKRNADEPLQRSPTWLQDAHHELDEAVFAAYGWSKELTDQEIVTQLLQLNAERFARQSPVLIGN